MPRNLSKSVVILAVLSLPLTVGGCSGSGGVKPKGQLVKNGQPVQRTDKDYYQVILIPEGGEAKTTYPATVKEDGSFIVEDVDSKGIPPGKYKVSIKNMVTPPRGGAMADQFLGKFDGTSSPFSWDLPGDGSVKQFDIGK